jgi:hypothetical protein
LGIHAAVGSTVSSVASDLVVSSCSFPGLAAENLFLRNPNLPGFRFRSRVRDGIIGETLKRQLRIQLRHLSVKSGMQKQIG